jgi:hypothetical protein
MTDMVVSCIKSQDLMSLGMAPIKVNPYRLMTTGLGWNLKMDAYILVTLV